MVSSVSEEMAQPPWRPPAGGGPLPWVLMVGVEQGKAHTPAGPHLECHRPGGTSVTWPASPRLWRGAWNCKVQDLCLRGRARAGTRAVLLFLTVNSELA